MKNKTTKWHKRNPKYWKWKWEILKKAAGVTLAEKETFEERFEGSGELAMVSEGRTSKGNSQGVWLGNWRNICPMQLKQDKAREEGEAEVSQVSKIQIWEWISYVKYLSAGNT